MVNTNFILTSLETFKIFQTSLIWSYKRQIRQQNLSSIFAELVYEPILSINTEPLAEWKMRPHAAKEFSINMLIAL